MRLLLAAAAQILVGWLFATASYAQVCGVAPQLPTSLATDETIKHELDLQASILSKLVGKAELVNKVEETRKSIYQGSDSFFAAQKDAYLAYLFCMIITNDKTLDTQEKLKALNEFRNPIQTPIQPNISGVRNIPAAPNNTGNTPRFFVNMNPDELMALYSDRYSNDGARDRIYVGKWIVLSGPLPAVNGPNTLGIITISFLTTQSSYMEMSFNQSWANKLAAMRVGKTFTSNCQIERIFSTAMFVDNCEIQIE